MSNEEFLEKAKELVREYTIEHIDKTDKIPDFNVYIIWSCKTLQNSKAILSTTIPDNKIYELTYNGNKNEIYLDCYVKLENKCVKLESEEN